MWTYLPPCVHVCKCVSVCVWLPLFQKPQKDWNNNNEINHPSLWAKLNQIEALFGNGADGHQNKEWRGL